MLFLSIVSLILTVNGGLSFILEKELSFDNAENLTITGEFPTSSEDINLWKYVKENCTLNEESLFLRKASEAASDSKKYSVDNSSGARVRRTFEQFGITCNIFENDEDYSARFEWTDEQFRLSMLYDPDGSHTVLFDRTLGIEKLFNGRREFSECFDPKPVGRAPGCKKCNGLCLRLFDMSTYKKEKPIVNFHTKVEQVTCNRQYFTRIDDCYNNHEKYAYCRFNKFPIILSGVDKQATRIIP